MDGYIDLDRQFRTVPSSLEDAENDEVMSIWGFTTQYSWDDIKDEYRCVILAEAGAGKTEELKQRALLYENSGLASFYIRIENIEKEFNNSFDIGNEDRFNSWLDSTDEAWFFLDSVDEARLENPYNFEKSIRYFAKGIAKGKHRAHIYITSRPYAWRPKHDKKLLDDILFIPVSQESVDNPEGKRQESALNVYSMVHLDESRIRRFCKARKAKDIDQLLEEIERTNTWQLAERPFDLEGILAKWESDRRLGSRLDLLHHNIERRLRDEHNTDRSLRQPLNLKKAKDGAQRLAAAVILTGQIGINVPDSTPIKPGIEADTILDEWDHDHIYALLERGIFNDIIYGAVRFRHRDVRELLAAEWFDKLLRTGNSRKSIETMFFRKQYDEVIVTPRLKTTLSWLILFDDDICRKALDICPEIAIESGDPSQLHTSVRKRILNDVVQRIASGVDDRSARDNSSIARIASLDLSEEARRLIIKHRNSDEAIFFLGRLVWQGNMESCTGYFVDIALDSKRSLYARKASIRAVMSCGTIEQKHELWGSLNKKRKKIPRELLSELLERSEPDSISIEFLIKSINKLLPYNRYSTSGLGSAIYSFVEKFPIADSQVEIEKLLNGLYFYLEKKPYIERRECHVSKEYAWLLRIATHVIERLVVKRHNLALSPIAISILLKVPALRFWADGEYGDYKGDLENLVPKWPELNDTLYWSSIEEARSIHREKSRETLIDDWSIHWLGYFWSFDNSSLPRLVNFIKNRELHEDKLMALSTAFRIYVEMDRPDEIKEAIDNAVAEDQDLSNKFSELLNPPVTEAVRKYEEKRAARQLERNDKQEFIKREKDNWIATLKLDPERVRNPEGLEPGEFTNDQYYLMQELDEYRSATDRSEYANWQALSKIFGSDVAVAYRDAAIKHWRYYVPSLRSEKERDNSVPYSLIFAMAGLEIEASENEEFPKYLDEKHVRNALRYITWHLNGFPHWFERMNKFYPELVQESVVTELIWELENTSPKEPMHYILHDLVYHAPWLYEPIAPVILQWMEKNPKKVTHNRDYCIQILTGAGIDSSILKKLARQQIANATEPDNIAWWYALLIDCDPGYGVKELKRWLEKLDSDVSTKAAQVFVTALMGGRRIGTGGAYFRKFRSPEYLKELYILMHLYIRVDEDIDRTGGGVFSPVLRDDAQEARSKLFSLLAEIPGKASYTAIKQLINEHPDPKSRPWMLKQAHTRAEIDGDLEPWTARQVREFDEAQLIYPSTHRQLFDVAVNRLNDLKDWLERGNDSNAETWRRPELETEVRNLISSWLRQNSKGRYTIAQEPELANAQRMDIWLHNTKIESPVPIELKLLDKNWTGPELCERLRNQLVGDYIRERNATCGVMLLVWQGKSTRKRWKINGHFVGLAGLDMALMNYWNYISSEYPYVDNIDIILIDLTMRSKVSET